MNILVNKLINKFGFKKSKLYYQIQRFRQINSLKPNLNHPKYKDILKELDTEGIVIIPDFISFDVCQGLVNDIERGFKDVKEGHYKGKFQYDEAKLIRLQDVDQMFESTKVFFENPFFDDLAKAYIDPRAHSYRREAELRDNNEINFQQGDIYHFDDWRVRFKYFLYLTDVNENNAPFVFVKNTHKNYSWKKKKNFEYESAGDTGSYGHYHPQEIRALKKIIPFEEVVCTGKAGTLIIADFRGLHKGTPLKYDRRILLNSTYGI